MNIQSQAPRGQVQSATSRPTLYLRPPPRRATPAEVYRMRHLSKLAKRIYAHIHHIAIDVRQRHNQPRRFPAKLETLAAQVKAPYASTKLAVRELEGYKRSRAGGKETFRQIAPPLISSTPATQCQIYDLLEVDVDNLLFLNNLGSIKSKSGGRISIRVHQEVEKEAENGQSGGRIKQEPKDLETNTKTTSQNAPKPDPGQDQGKSDDVGLHPVEKQVQKKQVEKRPRVSNTVLTLEDAVDHPRLIDGQPNAVDIQRGVDLLLTREGRPLAEELADLGYQPTTLAVWRKYLAYVARYEIDGLRDLVREVRAKGKRSMGGYAAHYINAGLQAPTVQTYVRGGAPAQEAPAYVRPIEARPHPATAPMHRAGPPAARREAAVLPEGVRRPQVPRTSPQTPRDTEWDAGLPPTARYRLSLRMAGVSGEAAG